MYFRRARLPIFRFPVAALALCMLAGSDHSARSEPTRLRVMTFNLRYASDTPPNSWPQRRSAVKNAILQSDPDCFGTQEGLWRQLRDMAEDLPAYDWIGEGREGGSAGEFMSIFFKRARLDPIAFGHFWLSDHPHVVASRTWGNTLPRMVTWVRFKEKESGVEFIHWNTHFDHISQEARVRSAELLTKEVRQQKPGLPMIVTGDFNQDQTNEVHQLMVGQPEGGVALFDQWDRAQAAGRIQGTQVGTWNGWKGPSGDQRRIDWILGTKEVDCLSAQVVLYKEGDEWPSDHFPVLAELELKSPN